MSETRPQASLLCSASISSSATPTISTDAFHRLQSMTGP